MPDPPAPAAPERGWYTTQEARQRLHVSKTQLLAYIEEGSVYAEQDRFGCWQTCVKCVWALSQILEKRRDLERTLHESRHDQHQIIVTTHRPPKPRADHSWHDHQNPPKQSDR